MKKVVLVFAVALCLFAAASTAHAQYWPSSSYSYNVYPGGGSYNSNVSNGYESVSWHQSAHYGSASVSYNYSGPYGSYYYWYRNTSYPVYYYPTYYYPTYYGYPLYQGRVYRIR